MTDETPPVDAGYVDKAYNRPPIVERVLTVWAKIEPEKYETEFESWRTQIEEDFPVYEPLQEWLLNVTEKEGVPIWGSTEPELKITPRFSKRSKAENFDWSLRCPADQLTVNMHSSPEEPRHYSAIRHVAAEWLHKWISQFSVADFTAVGIHYVNRLDAESVPSFYDEKGGLQINRLLRVFTHRPGPYDVSIIPPYECKVTIALREKENSTFVIHQIGENLPGSKPSLRLDFIVKIPVPKEVSSASEIMNLLDWGHDRIVERFELLFTDDALRSFEPRPK